MVSGDTMGTQSVRMSSVPQDRVSHVIFKYAASIGAAQNLDSLLALNAGMARDLVGADRSSIWLIDSKHNRLSTKVADGVRDLHVPLGKGLVGACVARNEAILANDTSSDERFLGSLDLETGYDTRSVLVMPLRGASGKPMGALQLLNKPGGFTSEDLDLLGLCTAYSASTLETLQLREESEMAQRLFREMEIARDVQQRLLPAVSGQTELWLGHHQHAPCPHLMQRIAPALQHRQPTALQDVGNPGMTDRRARECAGPNGRGALAVQHERHGEQYGQGGCGDPADQHAWGDERWLGHAEAACPSAACSASKLSRQAR